MMEPKFAALLWILWIIYRRRALSNRAEQIYEQVCEILEDNAINAKIDYSNCEPWVVTSWLRDHLLVPRERKNAFLWKKVEELILEDSRIDQYPKVIKGESKVVYEWQGTNAVPSVFSWNQSVGCTTWCCRESVNQVARLVQRLKRCKGQVKDWWRCDKTCGRNGCLLG